jgi:hypothetical protein
VCVEFGNHLRFVELTVWNEADDVCFWTFPSQSDENWLMRLTGILAHTPHQCNWICRRGIVCVSKSSVDWRNNFLMLWDSHTRNKTMHLENIPFINRMGISVSVVDDMSRWEKQTKIRMHYRRVREEWWISFFHWGGRTQIRLDDTDESRYLFSLITCVFYIF